MKVLLSCLVILVSFNVSFAQSEKLVEKANEKVEELNQMIIGEDPELALTDNQKAQIQKLHIQKLVDIKRINTSKATDNEKEKQRKAIYKAVSKKINQDVLTKEQRMAKKLAREKKKKK